MAAACHALAEVPADPWEPAPLEQAHAMLQGMSPPYELQDYHASLVELLAFGARTFDATPDLHLEAEMANRLNAHVVAAQALSAAVFAVIERQCPSDYAEMVGAHRRQAPCSGQGGTAAPSGGRPCLCPRETGLREGQACHGTSWGRARLPCRSGIGRSQAAAPQFARQFHVLPISPEQPREGRRWRGSASRGRLRGAAQPRPRRGES